MFIKDSIVEMWEKLLAACEDHTRRNSWSVLICFFDT